MEKILITSVLLFVLSIYHINTLADDKIDKRIFEPKIITTNYDSLAPLLKYNGWEKLSNEEKVKHITGWKEWITKRKIGYSPQIEELRDSVLINDEITALKLAEIYFYRIFGKECYFSVPFIAVRVNDSTWHVAGTTPPGWFGWIYMDINAYNGKVYSIWREK